MKIKIISVGEVNLLAQFDTTNPRDGFASSIVLVEVPELVERFVIWRIQSDESGNHAFHGQYYTDRSAALGRFIRRTEILDKADA